MPKIMSKHSHATEDYLKTIYELGAGSEFVTTNQIANRLNVTPASVTGMVKRLASYDPPLVIHRKHHGVALTEDGRLVALETLRHHRLLELFLHKTLGYSWDEVHEEADRLEHVISEEFEERIAEVLGHPQRDPHGDPIPKRDLSLPTQSYTLLKDLQIGQRAMVRQVENEEPEFLRYLSSLGMVPGVLVIMLAYSRFDENLTLQIEDKIHVLGPKVTGKIFVEVI